MIKDRPIVTVWVRLSRLITSKYIWSDLSAFYFIYLLSRYISGNCCQGLQCLTIGCIAVIDNLLEKSFLLVYINSHYSLAIDLVMNFRGAGVEKPAVDLLLQFHLPGAVSYTRHDSFEYDEFGLVEHRITFTANPPPHQHGRQAYLTCCHAMCDWCLSLSPNIFGECIRSPIA